MSHRGRTYTPPAPLWLPAPPAAAPAASATWERRTAGMWQVTKHTDPQSSAWFVLFLPRIHTHTDLQHTVVHCGWVVPLMFSVCCSYVVEIGGREMELEGCQHICVRTFMQPRCCPQHWGLLCLRKTHQHTKSTLTLNMSEAKTLFWHIVNGHHYRALLQSAVAQSASHTLMAEAPCMLLIRGNLRFSMLFNCTKDASACSQGFEPAAFRLLDDPLYLLSCSRPIYEWLKATKSFVIGLVDCRQLHQSL